MSDDFAPVSETEPVVEGSPSSSSESQVTEPSVLDMSQYAEYKVPVKFDGEELQVPLAEAIAGYQRQADYTRKTQELAQQREQLQFAATLQSALENDPAATLDLLSRHYGISRAQAQDMVDSFDEDLDPTERKMRELDQRIAQFEEYQTQQQIEKEISRLQSKYDDFDVNQVVNTAIKVGTNDLEAVYKQLAFDKYMKQRELEQAAAQVQQQQEAKVVEQKREAAVVSGGSSASNTTSESIEPISSITDAWMAAKRQLNANF